ncbi:MAG: alkaline phosphatase family protein [Bacteroidetes bacterium]|nr:alkaline phosphatase family protein [Bacteroidota bacterium]MCW5894490.1 alkaline phosphatase family protein [Bacteroidota bacterium]
MGVLMLFLDGVGIGTADASVNPFFQAELPSLRSLFGGELPGLNRPFLQNGTASLIPLDPNLGIEGLPQSGTGQTALFTGVNAPQLIGKHFGPYPYSTLRPVVRERNIFRQLINAGKKGYFANAYPQRFFDYFKDKQTRLTVTTLSCNYCDMPLHQVTELEKGVAVSADITNAGWPRMGYSHILPIEPAEAGRRLVRLTAEFDFVLFEYWRTDKAGHSEKISEAVDSLEVFDGMLGGILQSIDATRTLLLITSDHGNIEDMSTKVHTRNPVPAILFGFRQHEVAQTLRERPDLTGVTPALMEHLVS